MTTKEKAMKYTERLTPSEVVDIILRTGVAPKRRGFLSDSGDEACDFGLFAIDHGVTMKSLVTKFDEEHLGKDYTDGFIAGWDGGYARHLITMAQTHEDPERVMEGYEDGQACAAAAFCEDIDTRSDGVRTEELVTT
jgi:hypothetical protein